MPYGATGIYAGIGAAAGSFLPGIGTAIGGAVGTIVGFFASLFGRKEMSAEDFNKALAFLNKRQGRDKILLQVAALPQFRRLSAKNQVIVLRLLRNHIEGFNATAGPGAAGTSFYETGRRIFGV